MANVAGVANVVLRNGKLELNCPELWLRELCTELHRSNELNEARLALDNPDWAKSRQTPLNRSPKIVSMGVGVVGDWNERYEKERQAKLKV